MRLPRLAKLGLTAGLFTLALTSAQTSSAACSWACEATCVERFDRCVQQSGGWTENCQRLYDTCAFRCGCGP